MVGGRILVECRLAPLQGRRFQPTGFPDLGPAAYKLHDNTTTVLVDSPQAVVNHLEAHTLVPGKHEFVKDLEGLSMVVVKKGDKAVTNSVLEGHRLASPYVLGSKDKNKTAVGKEFDALDKKCSDLEDRSKIVKAILRYDVNSLLHGVWLSRTGEGRIRITRALSAFVEAEDASEAEYGGVKKDHVTTSVKKPQDGTDNTDANENVAGDASTGMGSIPYHRVDYTARTISAYFNVDLDQIWAYPLEEREKNLLKHLALWKIRRFVESQYRPRSACDLAVDPGSIVARPDAALPDMDVAARQLRSSIDECRDSLGGSQPITTVKFNG